MERLAQLSKERSAEEFKALLNEVEEILITEREIGKGKLGRNIKEIVEGPFGNAHIFEDGIVYLPPRGRGIFVGDTHGDSISTQAVLRQSGFWERLTWEPDLRLVFLGDYVDRGKADIENLSLVLSLKQNYPQNVILMRGNHEHHRVIPRTLPRSLKETYGIMAGSRLDSRCLSLFKEMTNVLVCGNGLVAVHGGIPNHDIESLMDLKGNEGLFDQIRWNDPSEHIADREPSGRGSDLTEFGEKAFERFIEAVGGSVMVRGHESREGEAALMFDDRLLTIFSTGGGSPETGYPEVSEPIFAEFDLSQPMIQISWRSIHPIRYSQFLIPNSPITSH